MWERQVFPAIHQISPQPTEITGRLDIVCTHKLGDALDFKPVQVTCTQPHPARSPNRTGYSPALEEAQAEFANPYLFPGSKKGQRRLSSDKPLAPPHFNAWSQRKAELEEKLPADTPRWTIHDLRRTARSLLSRAGVRPDISERVMGHSILGVEGVYDRHRYDDEKAAALQALANLIERIVNPPEANVVQFSCAAE